MMTDLEQLPLIDWEQALKQAGQKKHLAEEILNILLSSLPNELVTIKQLYQAQNYQNLQKQLHHLHGGLCYSGLPRIKTVVAELETALKNNDLELLPSLLDTLDKEVQLLLTRSPS